jgi:pantothenate kinase
MVSEYKETLCKLFDWLSEGGQLIIAVAPKYNDRKSDWSQIMQYFSGDYFDSLQSILSICQTFEHCTIEIYDEETSFDNDYESVDEAVDTMLFNLMEELSFCKRQNKQLQSKTIVAKLLRSYLQDHCVDTQSGRCLVTATVGHVVITKSTTIDVLSEM